MDMRGTRRVSLLCLLIVAMAVGGTLNCVVPSGPCAATDGEATVDVAGVYRYNAADLLNLSGTIEFSQDGNTVQVVNTTYDFGANRALDGEGTLAGNTLTIQLFPRNGDSNYRADVAFVFTSDGEEFCVGFSDTNDDAGEMGSFVGRRVR